MKNNHKPEIRFSGLSGDWELRKLEELLKERNEQMPVNEKYQLMSFTATEGVTPKSDRYNREFLVKSDNKKYKKTEKDDLIYSSNNLEVGSIGLNKTGDAVISPVYSIFHVLDGITPDFMGMLIRRKEFINKMLRYRQGVVYGQWRIHESDFLSIETLIPSIEEQTKIGIFFKQLEETIRLRQQELETLKQTKQGFLQKMFPKEGESVPEIRFNGFTQRWEELKLGEIADFFNEKRIPIESEKRTKGEYPYYGATGVIDYVKEYIFEGEYVLLAEDGANIVMRNSPLVYLTKGKFWVNNHAHIMKMKLGSNIFLAQVLENQNYKKYNSGTAQPKLNSQVVKNIVIKIPNEKEQHKIGDFFKQLDRVIAIHQQELDALKQTKKAFLQKMFV